MLKEMEPRVISEDELREKYLRPAAKAWWDRADAEMQRRFLENIAAIGVKAE